MNILRCTAILKCSARSVIRRVGDYRHDLILDIYEAVQPADGGVVHEIVDVVCPLGRRHGTVVEYAAVRAGVTVMVLLAL